MLSTEKAKFLREKVETGEHLSLINIAIFEHFEREVSACFSLMFLFFLLVQISFQNADSLY